MKNVELAIAKLQQYKTSAYYYSLLRTTVKYITECYFMLVPTPKSYQIASTIKSSNPDLEIYDTPTIKKPDEILTIIYCGIEDSKSASEILQLLKDSFIIIKNGQAVDDFLYSIDLMAQLSGESKLPIRRAKEFIEGKQKIKFREIPSSLVVYYLNSAFFEDLTNLFYGRNSEWTHIYLSENKERLYLDFKLAYEIDNDIVDKLVEAARERKPKNAVSPIMKVRKQIREIINNNYTFSLIKKYNASHFFKDAWDIMFFVPRDKFDYTIKDKKGYSLDYKLNVSIRKGFKCQIYPLNTLKPEIYAQAHFMAFFANYSEFLNTLYKLVDYRESEREKIV